VEVADRRDLARRSDSARSSGNDVAIHRCFGWFGARVVLAMSLLHLKLREADPTDARDRAEDKRTRT
jgi:hypothetical protein